MPVLVPLIFALVVTLIGFGALFVAIFGKAWGPYLSSRRQPIVTAPAMVASKREEMAETYTHHFDRRFGETLDPSDVVRIEPAEWYVAFECEDGETREFSVSQTLYEKLIIGDKGELKWRGHLFVGFGQPDVKRPEKAVPDDWM